jgi:hypothetical protein
MPFIKEEDREQADNMFATLRTLNTEKATPRLLDAYTIEKIVSDDFFRSFGTNGDKETLRARIDGAKFIISYLVNNKI